MAWMHPTKELQSYWLDVEVGVMFSKNYSYRKFWRTSLPLDLNRRNEIVYWPMNVAMAYPAKYLFIFEEIAYVNRPYKMSTYYSLSHLPKCENGMLTKNPIWPLWLDNSGQWNGLKSLCKSDGHEKINCNQLHVPNILPLIDIHSLTSISCVYQVENNAWDRVF